MQLVSRLKALIPIEIKRNLASKLNGDWAGIVPSRTSPQMQLAEMALFGAFRKSAIRDMERVIYAANSSDGDRELASWALAQDNLWHEEDELALQRSAMMLAAYRGRLSTEGQWLLHIETLLRNQRFAEAEHTIAAAEKKLGRTATLAYSEANLLLDRGHALQADVSEARLALLNEPFAAKSFAPITLIDPSAPLSLSNIQTASLRAEPDQQKMLSVLMPAYNCASTIEMAINSVLRQTWSNLELLIVDDASTDNTDAVIRKLATTDSRIKHVRQARNQGAYAARNRALHMASGDYVMVHDADDWSHPQRFAFQMREMMTRGGLVPNCSYGIRVSENLRVRTKPLKGAQIIKNTSSLLLDRADLLQAGGWHQVRAGADSELLERFALRLGQPRRLLRDTPLSFFGYSPTSLTQSATISVDRTLRYGARREYIEMYREWHSTLRDKAADLAMSEDPFPVPNVFRIDRTPVVKLDILLVSDFTLPGGTAQSCLNILEASKRLGSKIGVLHWPRYTSGNGSKNPRFMRYALENKVQSIVAGERVECPLTIVYHPNLLMDVPEYLPHVATDNCLVVFNQSPTTRTDGGRVAYDPKIALANAEAVFKRAPIVTPVSEIIRNVLRQHDLHWTFAAENWSPMVDAAAWRRPERTPNSLRPVIGRHARDARDKWPDSASEIRAAYCADRPAEVRILGGAARAHEILKRYPRNWKVHPFGSMDARDFLADLDVFVYHPHPKIIDAFPRAPVEAMAAGVPAILHPIFRDAFGAAALYAEPDDVWPLVQRLCADPKLYREQVARGYEFVRKTCDLGCFGDRIEPFISAASSHGEDRQERDVNQTQTGPLSGNRMAS